MMQKIQLKHTIGILFLFLVQSIQGQIGGEATYQFLSIPVTARTASLANSSVAVLDQDINLCQYNPSLLDSNLDQSFALNYANYIADINFGAISYAKHFKKIGTFSAGLQYFNYGKFTEANETGFKYAEFSAADYAFNVSYAKPIHPQIQAGVRLKLLYSDYRYYYSSGVALDGGFTYHSIDKNTSIALVFQNLGHQIKPYREGNYENLPFDVQLGFSKKFAHAPFRVMFSIHHLNNWSLAYDSSLDEERDVFNVNDEPEEKSGLNKFGDHFSRFSDEFIRHLNVGVELTPVKNLYLRAGFNFQRFKELAIKDKFGMTGFTFGVGLRIYKFHISYSRAVYHLSGITHTFSITSNLNEFTKR